MEKSGLIATDIEVLRLHYAETLRNWRRRFAANRDTIASLYDERFCRMFEFYLCGAEIAFRREGHMVFQIQLAHRQTAVPLTRDYITAFEVRDGPAAVGRREPGLKQAGRATPLPFRPPVQRHPRYPCYPRYANAADGNPARYPVPAVNTIDSPLLGLSQRLPPSNVQAEQALLGALLANNRAYERDSEFLAPEHFADPIHGRIYQAIPGESKRPARRRGHSEVRVRALRRAGGSGRHAYLAQLLTAMVGIINAGEDGRAVHDAWLRRAARRRAALPRRPGVARSVRAALPARRGEQPPPGAAPPTRHRAAARAHADPRVGERRRGDRQVPLRHRRAASRSRPC